MPLIKSQVSNDTFKKLQKRQKEKGIDSMAEYLREVVEEMLEGEAQQEQSNPDTEILKKEESIWICEMRLLLRYLVENTPQQPRANNKDILDTYKKRAEEHVVSLIMKR